VQGGHGCSGSSNTVQLTFLLYVSLLRQFKGRQGTECNKGRLLLGLRITGTSLTLLLLLLLVVLFLLLLQGAVVWRERSCWWS
jgi:hypothetical protein